MPSWTQDVVVWRMKEWGMNKAPVRLRKSVERVLRELYTEGLDLLKDPRLEVRVSATPNHKSVWAYFPIRPRWIIAARQLATAGVKFDPKAAGQTTLAINVARVYGNAREKREADLRERVRIVRELLPRPETRVLLLFDTVGFGSEKGGVFEAHLRDHLGHVLLYLRAPRAWNDCPEAMKEWRANRRPSARKATGSRHRIRGAPTKGGGGGGG